jgi:hypothetical protein
MSVSIRPLPFGLLRSPTATISPLTGPDDGCVAPDDTKPRKRAAQVAPLPHPPQPTLAPICPRPSSHHLAALTSSRPSRTSSPGSRWSAGCRRRYDPVGLHPRPPVARCVFAGLAAFAVAPLERMDRAFWRPSRTAAGDRWRQRRPAHAATDRRARTPSRGSSRPPSPGLAPFWVLRSTDWARPGPGPRPGPVWEQHSDTRDDDCTPPS